MIRTNTSALREPVNCGCPAVFSEEVLHVPQSERSPCVGYVSKIGHVSHVVDFHESGGGCTEFLSTT
jgi:hypothetical protein